MSHILSASAEMLKNIYTTALMSNDESDRLLTMLMSVFCFSVDNCQRLDTTLLQSNRGLSANEPKSTARLNEPTLSEHEPSTGSGHAALAIASKQQQSWQQQQQLPGQRARSASAPQVAAQARVAQCLDWSGAHTTNATWQRAQRFECRTTKSAAQWNDDDWRCEFSWHQRRR